MQYVETQKERETLPPEHTESNYTKGDSSELSALTGQMSVLTQ